MGPYLSTISNILVSLPASHHFIISYHSLFISVFNSIPNTLPKPKTSTQAFNFFFSLQPPIPTTTTSVLSLKHKPTKFISILEAPRKFTNPQQPIRCPNRWFFYGSKMRKEKRKKIKKRRKKDRTCDDLHHHQQWHHLWLGATRICDDLPKPGIPFSFLFSFFFFSFNPQYP